MLGTWHDSTRKVQSAGQWAETETNLQQVITELMLHFLFVVSFALLYAQNVVNKRPKAASLWEFEARKRAEEDVKDGEAVLVGEGFNFSLFGCFKDLHYLGYACCCPHIRAADTLAASGILSFEAGLMLYTVIFLVAHFGPAFNLMATFFIAIPLASNRRKLREKFGGQKRHGVRDYMASLCCWTCVVCQEARHVDEMTHTRVMCCCKFEFYGDPFEAIVGEAVHIRTTDGHPNGKNGGKALLHAASGPTEGQPQSTETREAPLSDSDERDMEPKPPQPTKANTGLSTASGKTLPWVGKHSQR